MNYFISVIIFLFGINLFFDPNPPITFFGIPQGAPIPFGLHKPLGIITSFLGLYSFYIAYLKHKQPKHPSHTKCPKCKKSYNYKDTNKGECPTCKIDTLDIDTYYEKYPEELKDAGK